MIDVPSFDARLSAYLAPIADTTPATYVIDDAGEMALCGPTLDIDGLIDGLTRQRYGREQMAKMPADRFRRLVEAYALPVCRALLEAGRCDPFLVRLGDNRDAMSRPGFVKSRPIANPGSGVLAPLNHARHFSPVAEVARADRPYDAKDAGLVWRGATTGRFTREASTDTPYSSRYHIRTLMLEAPPDVTWDIGYSLVTRPQHLVDVPLAHLHAATRPHLSMAELLGSKFLLVLEGNDVASSLKWILASESVPLMPHPTIESWACEALLEPYVHYVPVAQDLSDLAQAHAWCLDNDGACREIARAGQAFMTAFADPRQESRLFSAVVAHYADRVRLDAADPALRSLLARAGAPPS